MESEAPSSASINFLAWVEVNKKRLVIAGVALIGLVAVVSLVMQQQTSKETKASEALSEVKLPYNPSLAPAPGTADALLKVANDYRGTKAAARALLVSASVLYGEKNYDGAQKRYSQLIADYPDTQWLPEAAFGIAASLDAQGKTAEAIAKYEEVRKRHATSPVAEEAKLGLARLQETSKPEDAFKLYMELSKANPNTSLAAEADYRQEEMLRANPALAKLKEPIAPPVMPTITPQPVAMTNLVRRTNVPTVVSTNRPAAPVATPGK